MFKPVALAIGVHTVCLQNILCVDVEHCTKKMSRSDAHTDLHVTTEPPCPLILSYIAQRCNSSGLTSAPHLMLVVSHISPRQDEGMSHPALKKKGLEFLQTFSKMKSFKNAIKSFSLEFLMASTRLEGFASLKNTTAFLHGNLCTTMFKVLVIADFCHKYESILRKNTDN